ncbi:hypothetical protein C8D92_10370 [Tamilnaduibacter salinus]|uniref:Uncharacterized protein n=4 Tax=Tamilnaduibacter salinus TaxID=1484056 RepID=A0A2U1CXZ9_9GAMM|nr:hypothetical protein C8D92_10370 [Tamilnaduibacter salinus]
MDRLRQTWHSYRSLPTWVQIWVGLILVPANALPFAFLDTPTGYWAAVAALFVVMTNIPIMLACRGMSRLMSLPHLIAWIPLEAYLLVRLTTTGYVDATETSLAALLLIINGISLVFDTVDSIRWCRGEREVPGCDG